MKYSKNLPLATFFAVYYQSKAFYKGLNRFSQGKVYPRHFENFQQQIDWQKIIYSSYISWVIFSLYLFFILLIPAVSIQAEVVLTDTGQTNCYDDDSYIPCPLPGEPFYGQDGNYQTPNPTYQLSPDGLVVTDLNTGLMWQRTDDGNPRKWAAAISYCEELSWGGFSDWRLPSRQELVSIVNYSGNSPAINGLLYCKKADYWSSTTYIRNSGNAQHVDFDTGRTDHYGWDYVWNSKEDSFYVRCVRGNYNLGTYVNNNDGTVTDTGTGLIWQQADDGVNRNWEEALFYCESLELAGRNDWRLPNIRELQSILDDGRADGPAINPAFSCKYDWYHTSSTYAWREISWKDNYWGVDFLDGSTGGDGKSYRGSYVRCVSGGSAINDIDGDGINDENDSFPRDPNEWDDTDQDGIGNNADPDDDNDGMPDIWEQTYGLAPLFDDAESDKDEDGASNLKEYKFGTDPTNANSYPMMAMPWIPLLLIDK